MRRFMLATFVLFYCCNAFSQNTTLPKAEVFGGYSYLHEDISKDLSVYNLDHVNSHGWHVGGTQYVNRWFGATIDFSGNYAKVKSPSLIVALGGTPADADRYYLNHQFYTFLFGPQFAYRKSKSGIVPYGNFQLGAAYAKASASSALSLFSIDTTTLDPTIEKELKSLGVSSDATKASMTSFAFAANAGIEVPIHNAWGLRGNFRYLHTQFNNLGTDRQGHIGVEASLYYRF